MRGFDARAREQFGAFDPAVVIVDADGRVERTNAAAARLFGSAATVLGSTTIRDLFGRPGNDGFRAVRDVTRPDGTTSAVHVVANVLTGPAGDGEHTVWVAQDVSTRAPGGAARDDMFASLVEFANDAIVVTDADGTAVWANPAVERVLGYLPAELVSRSIGLLVRPEDRAEWVRRGRVAAAGSDPGTLVAQCRHKHGALVHVAVTLSVVPDATGAVAPVSAVIRDVSAEVVARRAVETSLALFRAIAETTREGLWVVDRTGRTRYANRGLAEILGVPLGIVYERPASAFVNDAERPLVAHRVRNRSRRGNDVYELTYQHPDGDPRILRVSAAPFDDGSGVTGSLALLADITAERRAEKELRHRALHDELSGLPNRALLDDRLAHAVAGSWRREGRSVALLLVDVDRFRLVNDHYGYRAGDAVLAQVAQRLVGAARASDTVARVRADRFAVVCEDTDDATAQELAERLRRALAPPFPVDVRHVEITVSIGVAVAPPTPPARLSDLAAAAVDDAKARGGACVSVYDARLGTELAEHAALTEALRAALADDRLAMHYQPIVDVATGKLRGVEALARWAASPVPVAPARIVAVAEASGFGGLLDRWAVRRVCRDYAALAVACGQPDLGVAVNLSRGVLRDDGFEAEVVAALREHRIPQGTVSVEVTEAALQRNHSAAKAFLKRLHTAGVSVAIDDFGTGYSSLGGLHGLGVTALKIDRSFIEHLTRDGGARAVTASIIDLSRTMNVVSVAEGVETHEQLDTLASLGCTAAQGFLWSGAVDLGTLGAVCAAQPRATFDVRPRDLTTHVVPRRRDRTTVEHGLHEIVRMRRAGASPATIAAALNKAGFRTPRGTRWHRTAVADVIADL